MLTAPRAMWVWDMLWDNPNFSRWQPHHHALHIADDAKEFRGHGSPLYSSQWHCLVYREEIIQGFLQIFGLFCLGTLHFEVLGYTGWRMGTNLRSTEIGYDQLQCAPLDLCFTPLHLCFLNFLLKHQTPTWDCKNSLASRKNWDLYNQPLAFECFFFECWSYQLFGICCKIIFLHHISVSTWSHRSNAWDIKIFEVLKRQQPSCMSLGEELCDFTSKRGNTSSNPVRFAQDVLCFTL